MTLIRQRVQFDKKFLDPDALKTVKKINKSGFEAFLVGGCIRDLLLGFKPKDFDIATNATPEQIQKLFKRSRIIGRRFKLVHVIFSARKFIEVATFRSSKSNKTSTKGMVLRDNYYGFYNKITSENDNTCPRQIDENISLTRFANLLSFYSKEKRFNNILLNLIYQTIFRLSLKFSNFKTSPSKKLIKKLKNKIFYLPNSPKLKTKKIYKNKKNELLIFIPKIDDGINLDIIMDSLEILKRKKIEVKFLITGSFSNKNIELIIRRKIEKRFLKKNMLFLGFVKDDKKIIRLLNNSKIGVTTYNMTDRHNYYEYSDSLKIRQYAEFGLPILTEGLTPLAKEVASKKFGFIFRNSKDLSNKIIKIIFKNEYKHLSKNSRIWALKNSREKFVNKLKKQLNI